MGYEERAQATRDAQRQAFVERMLGDPQPFAAHEAGCPKCGAPRAAQKPNYCFGVQALEPDLPCKVPGDHLHVVCTLCNFQWLERCKDWTAGA